MALTTGGWGGGGGVWDPFSWDPFYDTTWGLGDLGTRGYTTRDTDVGTRRTLTHVDWWENEKEHNFRVDLPGLKKDQVQLQIEEPRTLRISGEFIREGVGENDTWHRMERRSGRFIRRFRLPDDADVNQIKAEMEHGVLNVKVPKTGVGEPERRSVAIA